MTYFVYLAVLAEYMSDKDLYVDSYIILLLLTEIIVLTIAYRFASTVTIFLCILSQYYIAQMVVYIIS